MENLSTFQVIAGLISLVLTIFFFVLLYNMNEKLKVIMDIMIQISIKKGDNTNKICEKCGKPFYPKYPSDIYCQSCNK